MKKFENTAYILSANNIFGQLNNFGFIGAKDDQGRAPGNGTQGWVSGERIFETDKVTCCECLDEL